MGGNTPWSALADPYTVTSVPFPTERVTKNFSVRLLEDLKALGREENATLAALVRGAYEVLLRRYLSGEDFDGSAGSYGSPLDEPTPFFARADLSGNPTFRQLLRNLRSFLQGCSIHPASRCSGEGPQSADEAGREALFQVRLAWKNSLRPQSPLPAVDLRSFSVPTAESRSDFALTVREAAGAWMCAIEYSPDLFDGDGIRRFLGHLQTLLEGIAANPDRTVAEMPILQGSECEQILERWNQTPAEYPRDLCLHQIFERQVEKTPDAVACVFPGNSPESDRQISYRELNERSNQLAHYLRRQGAGRGVPVGIFLERSIEMMIGLLGIQKSGATYIPLDPGYPRERVKLALEDAKVPILVTQESLLSLLSGIDARVLCLERDSLQIAGEPVTNPGNVSGPEDLIYVIFTSGSTGRPKGVQIQQRSVVNLLTFMAQALRFGANDVFPALAPFAFDMCIPELYLALITGGRVVIVKREAAANGQALAALLRRTGAIVVHATPTTWNMLLDAGFDGKGLKRAIGAEPVPPELCRLLEADASLYNFYGPTETTVWSTYHHFASPDEPVVVGKPLANTQVYILDKNRQPLPVGVAGEIYIGGDGVALGYLNRPELTSERFVRDPFHPRPGARLYRTGDLAKYLPDGKIQHLGRNDFQVKVRGFRIELGEIESALAKHPAVRQAVVTAREDKPGDKRLVAYLVLKPAQRVSIADIRAHLKHALPDYMIPAALVELEALPLTPVGKVDRKNLPAPDWACPQAGNEYVAPQTLIEELVARVLAEVLKVEGVGREDNFFEMGGHSLSAAQSLTRLEQMFQLDIPLRTIFESPTVAALAHAIEKMPRTVRPADMPFIAAEKKRHGVPLSFAQEALWYEHQVDPNSPAYNVPLLSRLHGPLDVKALEKALFALIERHELLRSAILSQGGSPVLFPLKKWRGNLQQVDLRHMDLTTCDAEAQRLTKEEAAKPFDLARDPLFRCVLIRMTDDDWLLMHNSPHIVFDGGSVAVLYRDLAALYDVFSSGNDVSMPELPFQFADFAAWQRRLLQGEYLASLNQYWTRQLTGAPNVEIPLDYPRPASQRYRGTRKFFAIPPDLLARAVSFFRSAGTTAYRGLYAAFNILLCSYTGLEDICLGTPVAPTNPACLGVENLIGHFVNTVVLRSNLSGDPTFREVVRRSEAAVDGALMHSDLPLNKVVEALRLKRDPSRPLLFQVNFRAANHGFPSLQLKDIAASPAEYIDTGTSKFDLALEIESTEGKACYFEYRTDLFREKTIAQMQEDLQILLGALIARPDTPLSQMPEVAEIGGRVRRGKAASSSV